MTEQNEFLEILALARTGDATAMEQLVNQYEPQVRSVVRYRLGPALRPFLDSMDVTQSVHRSLMLGLRNDRFEISSPEHLVGLAVTMVQRKIARHWRRLRRQQCVSLSKLDPAVLDDNFPISSTDPAYLVEHDDALQNILDRMPEADRRVVEFRLLGYSTAQAARELDLDANVVRARLSQIRRKLRAAGVLDDWI